MVIFYWAIWYLRNQLVHEGFKGKMQELVDFIWGYVEEHSLFQKDILPSQLMINKLWRPPDNGIIKLNFDASFQVNVYFSTTAVIAKNDDGQIIGACSYLYFSVVDVFIVTALACERTLIFAIEIGFSKNLDWRGFSSGHQNAEVIRRRQIGS